MFALHHCVLDVCVLCFDFIEGHSRKVAVSLRRSFGLPAFEEG